METLVVHYRKLPGGWHGPHSSNYCGGVRKCRSGVPALAIVIQRRLLLSQNGDVHWHRKNIPGPYMYPKAVTEDINPRAGWPIILAAEEQYFLPCTIHIYADPVAGEGFFSDFPVEAPARYRIHLETVGIGLLDSPIRGTFPTKNHPGLWATTNKLVSTLLITRTPGAEIWGI